MELPLIHQQLLMSHPSKRISFQILHGLDSFNLVGGAAENDNVPQILNVGSADDPVEFKSNAHHVDIDDWSAVHDHFTQANAESMPMFEDESFDMVMCGDVLEHVLRPIVILRELCRIAKRKVVLTIFEEWRHGKSGRDIELGQTLSDEASRVEGYKDAEDAQKVLNPDRIGIPESEVPHLTHIWQFNNDLIESLFDVLVTIVPFEVTEFNKQFETTYAPDTEDEHAMYNWLIVLTRITP